MDDSQDASLIRSPRQNLFRGLIILVERRCRSEYLTPQEISLGTLS